jgi:hypothetical protein
MKRLYWKFRFARHLKNRIRLTFWEAFGCAEEALEIIENDLSCCPIYSAEERYFEWIDASR